MNGDVKRFLYSIVLNIVIDAFFKKSTFMNPKQGIFYLKLSNNFEISNIDQQRKLLENL